MNKFKNKKGFSLIEMLIVIAIVAALVSIIVPTVQEATLKSRAATNAANLREVEGALATLRVGNYDAFMTASSRLEANLSSGLTGAVKDRLDFWFPGLADEITKSLATVKAENGTLTLDMGYGVEQVTAPGSKELNAPGTKEDLKIEKDAQMEIYVTENNIICMYAGYTKEDFADVAEDGVYDGGSGSSGGGTGGVIGGIIGDVAEDVDEYLKCSVDGCNNYRVLLTNFCSGHQGYVKCSVATCGKWYPGNSTCTGDHGHECTYVNHKCTHEGCTSTTTCSHGSPLGAGTCSGCGNTNAFGRCPYC